ncbi:MAG TPA: PTS sugar transporter subunit IIA [Candidatus Hydrogenedentes bacterium]|nr:PTS sugar transporter subunit IIA [Candidatus Hydrogenedentota bacterium]HNT89388.1 PTS sugar transporter subunit IIA [Candidatus Hydrogenedentota bacterium]
MKEDLEFSKDLVLLGLDIPDKWDLIEHMTDALAHAVAPGERGGVTRNRLYEAVLTREREKATGLANGLAFPHARIPGLPKPCLCVARLRAPIDFGAMDGLPVDFVVLLVVPEDQPNIALRVMSQFARLFGDAQERAYLLSLADAESVHEFLARRVLSPETLVTARDIMREPYVSIHPDTPLKDVTRYMRRFGLDAIAVVENDGTLVGEITCERLFTLGMPDFFSQLKSVSFISEFDPFEKYFAEERQTTARDVMETDYAAVPENATLLEIVFELAVRRHSKVHVVQDGKRIGAIDRILVLDRVINI